ncbi:unnamed protein product [Ectocarpus sp. 12 AP-2014]
MLSIAGYDFVAREPAMQRSRDTRCTTRDTVELQQPLPTLDLSILMEVASVAKETCREQVPQTPPNRTFHIAGEHAHDREQHACLLCTRWRCRANRLARALHASKSTHARTHA